MNGRLIDEDTYDRIVRLARRGHTTKQIVAETGCNKHTVSRVRRRAGLGTGMGRGGGPKKADAELKGSA